MARRYYRVQSDSDWQGVSVEHDAKERMITVSGWYDHMVGIEPLTMTLPAFLRNLGLPKLAAIAEEAGATTFRVKPLAERPPAT